MTDVTITGESGLARLRVAAWRTSGRIHGDSARWLARGLLSVTMALAAMGDFGWPF